MTSRRFKDRLGEHTADIKYERKKTAQSRLSLEEDITMLFNESQVIAPYSNWSQTGINLN